MNILQAITSTGSALQVVRAQTIQTSHSSASSRRAITSTTYSHYTNGAGNLPSSNCGGGDLLVRLINKLMWWYFLPLFKIRGRTWDLHMIDSTFIEYHLVNKFYVNEFYPKNFKLIYLMRRWWHFCEFFDVFKIYNGNIWRI